MKGDLWATAKFIDSCELPYIAPSLGGVESLIEQPTVVSYWDQGPEKRAEIGIKDNLVRFSTGIEDYADIEADISQALINSMSRCVSRRDLSAPTVLRVVIIHILVLLFLFEESTVY